MDYYEFMLSIKEDDDSISNLMENDSVSSPLGSDGGDILEPWDEESCDDFFLGADPYIPLY